MSILTNFHWKLRELLCLLVFFSTSTTFLAAQNCPTPTGLSKDSTSIAAVYYSWNAVLGARGYKVTYTTPSDTISRMTPTSAVSFALPINTDFEIFTVSTICGNGDESDPAGLIDGGIVITVDDIFRIQHDCNDPHSDPQADPIEFYFFSDLCMYTRLGDLCQAIDVVNSQGSMPTNEDPEKWLNEVIHELSTGNYLWEPWDNPDGCQEPLRLQKPVLSEAHVSPNPFNDSFIVRFQQENPGSVSFDIIDAMGRTVERRQISSAFSGEQRVTGMGSRLPSGVYFLRISCQGQQLLIHILKQE